MMGNSYIFIFVIFFVVMAIDVQLFGDTEGIVKTLSTHPENRQ